MNTGIEGKFYVYEHIRLSNDDIFYVGKGCGNRAYNAYGRDKNRFWKNIVEKDGGYDVRIIASGMCEELAFFVEEERISQLRHLNVRLTNMTDGGDGIYGAIRHDEWKRKIGDAHRGKTLSAEVRKKISDSVKSSGYSHGPEQKKKISDANKGHARSAGYKHTNEWKEQNRIRMLGNKSRTGQKQSQEEKRKRSDSMTGRPQQKIECPHCGKIGGNSMRRWHFENCKNAEVINDSNTRA